VSFLLHAVNEASVRERFSYTQGREVETPVVRTDSNNAKLLGSWKEIAAYFGKGVRTVQRWENDLGLPVRRPNGAAKGVVCATPEELDQWLAMQWARRSVNAIKGQAPNNDLTAAVDASRELRRANRQLLHELTEAVHGLQRQAETLSETVDGSQRNRNRRSRRRGE